MSLLPLYRCRPGDRHSHLCCPGNQSLVHSTTSGGLHDHPAVQYLPEIDFVTTHLINTVQPGDVVVVLSAGDANRILPDLLQKLEEKE